MRFVPPVARHAGFPGYTSESQPPSPLDWNWAVERLRDAPNYWVCTTTASGAPHAMPVWAVWVDEAVCFSTGVESVKARNPARDPRVVIHLESGDEAVILHGVVDTLDRRRSGDAVRAQVRPSARSLAGSLVCAAAAQGVRMARERLPELDDRIRLLTPRRATFPEGVIAISTI